jgi:Protein of unknown function (DUF1488)
MPLTRGREDYVATMNGVRFLMLEGTTEVPCRAASALLREQYGSDGEGKGDAAAFENYRSTIEHAASEKYDAGKIDSDSEVMIIVTSEDVVSHLSLKM